MYRVVDCRVMIKNSNSKMHPNDVLWVLIEAQNDVHKLTGSKNPQIFMEEGARSGEIVATFLDHCENRRKLIELIFDRARQISPGGTGYRVVSLNPSVPISGQFEKSPLFRDTRKGLHDYPPPRHDIK